ncbi:ester cyclase [Haloglomus litoreum]|uniref:ester cyclase n=1 Tax=Haloglomus litoreum TaxID=3034026 RepID=UPI0023E777EE|nr:nuclear transport factor 2 family protein [Haloglomus sp. DT116]
MSGNGDDPRPAAELAREYFGHVRDRDPDAMAEMVHEDLVEEFLVLGTFHGRAALRDLFAELFAAVPDSTFETETVHAVDEDTAIGQWRFTGTFDGGPFQGIEPTGAELDFRGVDVMEFEVRDGEKLLSHNTIYYDGLTFARQVGLLPDEDSLGDRALMTGFNGLTKVRRELLD